MRVLLVEDERALAGYVKKGLEENGWAVDAVEDGRSALDWVGTVDYDVMILDLMLPQIGGLEVCRRLRQRGLTTPVLMLTARDALKDRVSGLDAGADDYLPKPFEFEELLARLRALTRRRNGVTKTGVLTVADLSLDPAAHRVRRAGLEIDLPYKEFSILELLLSQPGRVFSRSQIADHVWDMETLHQSNVVDVHIRNLRRLIGDGRGQTLIETVRGVGYRVQAPGGRS
ncbi:MAG: response regulator transcription factor [Spirochaetales bacterium]|nr:response regulator transcription factor [Spirochaetales bacterium]